MRVNRVEVAIVPMGLESRRDCGRCVYEKVRTRGMALGHTETRTQHEKAQSSTRMAERKRASFNWFPGSSNIPSSGSSLSSPLPSVALKTVLEPLKVLPLLHCAELAPGGGARAG